MIEELLPTITQTTSGYPVRNLKWNKLDNIIVGQVQDPILGDERRLDGYVVCQWRSNGTTTNRFKGRDDLKLLIDYNAL
jgi:hypothetical protein